MCCVVSSANEAADQQAKEGIGGSSLHIVLSASFLVCLAFLHFLLLDVFLLCSFFFEWFLSLFIISFFCWQLLIKLLLPFKKKKRLQGENLQPRHQIITWLIKKEKRLTFLQQEIITMATTLGKYFIMPLNKLIGLYLTAE